MEKDKGQRLEDVPLYKLEEGDYLPEMGGFVKKIEITEETGGELRSTG